MERIITFLYLPIRVKSSITAKNSGFIKFKPELVVEKNRNIISIITVLKNKIFNCILLLYSFVWVLKNIILSRVKVNKLVLFMWLIFNLNLMF